MIRTLYSYQRTFLPSILGPTLGRWVVNIFIWLLYWGRSVRHCVAKLFGWMKSERMISSEDGSLAGAGTAYAIMFWQVILFN